MREKNRSKHSFVFWNLYKKFLFLLVIVIVFFIMNFQRFFEIFPFFGSPKVLRFKKMSENAYTPTKGSKLAAGFDLYSAHDLVVGAKGKALVKTDLQIQIPENCYGRIAPRSGLAHKNFIDVGAGVIDADYRGNVGVILFNFGDSDFKISKGDRIAQLICERIEYPELEEICGDEEIQNTDRGAGGFGSTGKN